MARPKKGEEKCANATISLRIPETLKSVMKLRAERERRSFSAQVIIAIEQHLSDKRRP